MAKITQYPAKTVPSNNDEFVLHDTAAGSTKKMTRGDLIGGAPLPANSVNGQAIAGGAVTAAKTAFGGNYSTSEVNTGFTWIDGKPIYKRTFTGTHTTNTSLILIASSGIDSLVDSTGWTTFEGAVYNLGDARYLNTGSLYYGSSINKIISSGNINLFTTGTASGSNTHAVTLYYTKV